MAATSETARGYVPVIGLEVHAQLLTKTKIFCSCRNRFGDPPNTNTCPVCLGFPGSLPVLNATAVELAIRMALATGCTVHRRSVWARKNYFYPDLPKGYQISQYDQPLATKGSIAIELDGATKRIGVTRIHMEEDAGKLIHDGLPSSGEASHVDFNRAGVPLIEIVGDPDIRTPEEAYLYLQRLKSIVTAVGVCDGNMEEGSLRCDANISIRRSEGDPFGTRVELKNLNSFRNVQRALEYEIARQEKVLDAGGTILKETRLYDATAGETRAMRMKEEEHDYRYFPDPDLLPLVVSDEWIERARRSLPELPTERKTRFVQDQGIPEADAHVLTLERPLADYYESAVQAAIALMRGPGPVDEAAVWRETSKWVLREILTYAKNEKVETADLAARFPVERLASIVSLRLSGSITAASAAEVFEASWATGADPGGIVRERGLAAISDAGSIAPIVDAIVAANPKQLEQYRNGKAALFGYFVGQVMKAAGGKANPDQVNALLKKALGEPES